MMFAALSIKEWTTIIVLATFALYIGIAWWARAGSTGEFYVAAKSVSPWANGAATAADWMSAASFLSMAGIISFAGRDGCRYLMGWTGGYVLLALLLAPYLRKFGKFTVPDFVGERYYSQAARVVAVVCAIFVSFTYVAGQMRGVGVVFSRFLDVSVNLGVIIGMAIVLTYAVLGGMKGITYTQVAQYCVLIFAFMVPAIFISFTLTGNVIPQIGFGADLVSEPGVSLLEKLNGLHQDLGFEKFTDGNKSTVDMFCITAALMVGTAGLPHVIIRFFTVKKVRDARLSAGIALLFITLLYTTAPAVAAFARTNLLQEIPGKAYAELPTWFQTWENTDMLVWVDKDGDGKVKYGPGKPFEKKPKLLGETVRVGDKDVEKRGPHGQRLWANTLTDNDNELYIDRDIMVLANPEMAGLAPWVIALVAAGGLAAALSTAAGLLLVISTAISHDLMKKVIMPKINDKQELLFARLAAVVAVVIAGLFGIYPPGFVAEVVAFAFGLAASSFFPIIVLGIFWKRMNREGAIAGMVCGILFTGCYIIYFRFPQLVEFLGMTPLKDEASNWLWGISPEGIGTLGMVLNFAVAIIVTLSTAPPPKKIQDLVGDIRIPRG